MYIETFAQHGEKHPGIKNRKNILAGKSAKNEK